MASNNGPAALAPANAGREMAARSSVVDPDKCTSLAANSKLASKLQFTVVYIFLQYTLSLILDNKKGGQMESAARIEQSLEAAVDRATAKPCPPKLAKAVHYAVFPGGARVRPTLTLAVAAACGGQANALTDGAAAAIEMLHCASLVHDDLPCFDNASLRRGKPSVHNLYGEPMAVLVGDALIVEAFNTIARTAASDPAKLVDLIECVSMAVGMPGGIVAGQAWESETKIDLIDYHRAKTGSLFVGSVSAGAIAGGSDPSEWHPLGEKIGEAYQLADDLLDATGSIADSDKPLGQDRNNSKPNAVMELGLEKAMKRLKQTIADAADSVPACAGTNELRELIVNQATRLVPAKYATAFA